MTPQTNYTYTAAADALRIEDLTRREFMSSALAAAFLIACGDNDEEEPSDEGSTRTVDTIKGAIEVPVNPRRVVTIGHTMDLQVAYDLGASLVAAGGTEETRVHVDEATKKLPVIQSVEGEPDVEAILNANPDIILTNTSGGVEDTVYERLSQVAPTVLIFTDDTRNDWRGSILMLADALNRREEAEAKFAELDKRIAELETRVKEAWPEGVRVSLLRMTDPGEVRSYRTGSGRIGLEIINNLEGVTVAGNELAADSPTASNVTLSVERLREVDADVILYWGPRDKADEGGTLGGIVSNPLWPSLEAVKAGRTHQVSQDVWFDGFGFTGINLALDDMFQYLTTKAG